MKNRKFGIVMIIKVIFFGSCLILGLFGSMGSLKAASSSKAHLVVGLVVDQMRWDYLERFQSRFGEGGFRRLMDQGFRYDQAFIPYVPTYTAAGHATLFTGAPPSIHGIVANDWIENPGRDRVYCVQDPRVRTLGVRNASQEAGRRSPHRLRTTTVGDELKSRDPHSRVYGISLKDRGAILPAGHRGDLALWLDDETGTWISSSHYGSTLPDWVNALNRERGADRLLEDWELLYPDSTYLSPMEDVNPYEGDRKGWGSRGFPHRIPEGEKDYGLLRYMPAGNDLVFMAARACLSANQLGRRESLDFLALSFSATDYAGHLFGPESREVEDMYLRLDRSLAAFLDYLDENLGEGHYTLFLSADHGAASNPRYLKDQGVPAGIFSEKEWADSLKVQLKEDWGVDSLVRGWMNDQIYLDHAVIREAGLDWATLDAWMEAFFESREGLLGWIRTHGGQGTAFRLPRELVEMIARGYQPSRSGDYYLVNLPGWYGSQYQRGTTHGSWNPYDTHIPLIWFGGEIPKGRSWRKVSMVDVAPTLSALMGIAPPNGSVGEVLLEIMPAAREN